MVKLSDIELPMIFKDRLLFSHGIRNNWNILPEEITKSLGNTKWEDQRNRSLFLAHTNRDAQKWVGRITNPYVMNGELFGDLEVHDADLAMKLGPGKAPIGVSAEIRWSKQYSQPTDFTYRGFAMVPNPEVPDTMINFSKEDEDNDFNKATIFVQSSENVAKFSDDGIVTSETSRGSNENEETIEEVVESNLINNERGLNKIKMEEKQNNVDPEVKEEVVEKVEEVKKEEVVETESKEADFAAFNDKFEALVSRVNNLEANLAKFSEESVKEEVEEVVEEVKEEVKEEIIEEKEEVEEVIEEEAKAEEEVAEDAESESEKVIEDVTEKVEEVKEEEVKVEESIEAEFSAITEKLDQLVDVLTKKEAAPMSTAEFGNKGIDSHNAVIDRLTLELQK